MEVVELVMNGEEFVTIGDDPRMLPVYSLGGGTRQLTNMRWLGLTRSVTPDSYDVKDDLIPGEIRERYGTALPPPSAVRPLDDDRGTRDLRPKGLWELTIPGGQ